MTHIDERDQCDDCGEYADQCTCDPLSNLIWDVSGVLVQLDRLAELWGDEGVFRRCRDGLREAVKKAEKWVKE